MDEQYIQIANGLYFTEADRRQHLLCLGRSGSGKSTLLRNLIHQDIEAGRAVCFVDPHGDEAKKILDLVPSHRAQDVCYLDAGDVEHPFGLNLLEDVAPDRRSLAADAVVATFRHRWSDSWGPNLERLLRNCVLALLEVGSSTIVDIERMIVSKDFRKDVVRRLTDLEVRSFWEQQYDTWSDRLEDERTASTLNKIGALLADPLLRNIFGQLTSTVHPAVLMNSERPRIVILNLRKGRTGETAANLIGSFWVTLCQLAAMEREAIPPEERKPFPLILDEFQDLVTRAIEPMLRDLRKQAIPLTIASQYLGVFDEGVIDAIMGNVGSIVAFRVSPNDAKVLAPEFADDPLAEPNIRVHLSGLDSHDVYAQVLQHGRSAIFFAGAPIRHR